MATRFSKTLIHRLLLAACLSLAVPVPTVFADSIEIVIRGIDGALLQNVEAQTRSFRISANTRLSGKRMDRYRTDMEQRAAAALRPFGYYHANVRGSWNGQGDSGRVLILDIDEGDPVRVAEYTVQLTGPGASERVLREWQSEWPLTDGRRLNQATWEEQKNQALNLAESRGYLSAAFSEQSIRLDLLQNRASLTLILDTGPQAVMGTVTYLQDAVNTSVLENLPRFQQGQAYNAWLLEQFRLDLWRTGYYENIEVVENRRLDETPPQVDLMVTLQARKPNTYQGSIGFGTDSGIRLQTLWTRHILSHRGDILDVGFGWKEKRNEFNFRTGYRLPRAAAARQYWTADLLYQSESQAFKVQPVPEPPGDLTIARGDINSYSIRPGILRIRDRNRGYQQIFERWYVQYLRETADVQPTEMFTPSGPSTSYTQGMRDTTDSTSLGVSWEWPVIRGSGFQTRGRNHRAWLFTSNTAWGSDLNFSQAYLSSRWSIIRQDRWKFLLRGEIGYSDARVDEGVIETEEGPAEYSITQLPNAYRFKTGGSQSVRGYGFENLSNNNIGSNNIVTASAEIEFKFLENWSAAAFFDIGNAFNDWSRTALKKGAGVGIRWYSIAGPIRIDVAQALDEPGKPWRLHFTIGSPLL